MRSGSGGSAQDGPIPGEITVLTQRTDIVETVEAITDYEGEVRIRLNTQEYGQGVGKVR